MQDVSSLSIGPTSDLVVHAPWMADPIVADEPVLPATRLARTFQTLFALGRRSSEAGEVGVFAGPIQRLERIHSFRFAAEREGLQLSVTFDFGWESYMRTLWADAGPFLDLLCCHCADYPLARETGLAEWRDWIRQRQRRSDYFYSATPLTVGDLATLSQCERLQRDTVDPTAGDRLLAGFATPSAVEIAAENRARRPHDAVEQAVAVIRAMYALTRYWTADVRGSALKHDAITLIRATRAMIEETFLAPGSLPPPVEARLAAELAWYRQRIDSPEQPAHSAAYDPGNVQRGIVRSFDTPERITHGAAVFLAVTDWREARRSLARLLPTSEAHGCGGGIFRNLAFTYRGLERLRLPDSVLTSAPPAFREGAAARAGLVGDVHSFHPSYWQPLRRNWAPDPGTTAPLDQVDVLVQLRTAAPGSVTDIGDHRHPLHHAIAALELSPGLALLAVEGLNIATPDGEQNHLGFRDGLSQPTLAEDEHASPWSDTVSRDALLVPANGLGEAEFWADGSFLAVRRMPVDRARFDALLAGDSCPGLRDRTLLAAKVIGRMPDGTPLAPAYGPNNFTYDGDKQGAACPLASHVRRANPRRGDPPRIMRRGMSFGPPMGPPDGLERGTFFMAYCADLAEQYERVLAWVNGGNSTGVGSYVGDPLAGAPDWSGQTYRFVQAGTVHRLRLPEAQRRAVGLSWSLYLFAPSLATIAALDKQPEPTTTSAAEVERGHRLITHMRKTDASEAEWRLLLGEPSARARGDTAALWTAIRARGGLLDTPVAYLVGGYDLVMQVLRDDGARFSNTGAGGRMGETIGPFHLGMDPGSDDYKRSSEPANTALRSIEEATAFGRARSATKAIVAQHLAAAGKGNTPSLDLLKDLIEPLLACLATDWFGLPDEVHIATGAQDWSTPDTRKPHYPGDFWTPSLYTFAPFPTGEIRRRAVAQGRAIIDTAAGHIRTTGRDRLTAPVAAAIAAGKASYPTDEDLAHVLVGCMVGGVPTVAVNALTLLVSVIDGGKLDRAQSAWLLMPPDQRDYSAAVAYLYPAVAGVLTRNPVPELLWRTVAG